MCNTRGHGSRTSTAGRILVLDDESNVRAILLRWLQEASYSAIEARDVDEAWQCLRDHQIDLMTIDIRLPGGCGLDLVHRIRRDFPDTALLMLTGVDDARQAVAALTRGAFGYLIKPVDREAFLANVRNGLALRDVDIKRRTQVRRLEACVEELEYVRHLAHQEILHPQPGHAHASRS
jgi:putative two-component system response regulator